MTDHTPTTAGQAEAIYSEIAGLLAGDNGIIPAIKKLRGLTNCGLKEALDACRAGTYRNVPIYPKHASPLEWTTAFDEAKANLRRITELEAEVKALREALTKLVNARALKGVRELVAGWNGEGKPHGPYERHPSQLGATLPKTNCGAVYELDEAMTRARSLIPESNNGEAGE